MNKVIVLFLKKKMNNSHNNDHPYRSSCCIDHRYSNGRYSDGHYSNGLLPSSSDRWSNGCYDDRSDHRGGRNGRRGDCFYCHVVCRLSLD